MEEETNRGFGPLILIVATDMGVFITYDGGDEWIILGDNLPNVVVNDLVWHQPTNKLIAGTFGRSMYSYDLEQDPITQVSEFASNAKITVAPNPFKDQITLSIDGDITSTIFRIFDVSGKLIIKLSPDENGNSSWNGKDENGNTIKPGIYFLESRNGLHKSVKKIIKQ